MCIHELEGSPGFLWDTEHLAESLASVRHRQGRLVGRMEALGFDLRREAVLATLTSDVVKSSEIEGEKLDAAQVRSSIARRLGMVAGALRPADRHVEGIVEMMLDATGRYDQALTADRLFGWHAALFPTGRSGMTRTTVGAGRDDGRGPMEVVSGPIGKERVHFTAPPAHRLANEMAVFLDWFNKPADMALARSEKSPQRFYSMSRQIRREREAYYEILERMQRGTMDITPETRSEPFARRLRREADKVQVREAREMLPGYSAARHPPVRRAWHPRPWA